MGSMFKKKPLFWCGLFIAIFASFSIIRQSIDFANYYSYFLKVKEMEYTNLSPNYLNSFLNFAVIETIIYLVLFVILTIIGFYIVKLSTKKETENVTEPQKAYPAS
jgi:flagellar biosynthesis/type III secretory pathway M-ring protein FliF/YscJ